MTNTNSNTGIPYGYISALKLDPEIVERLLNGRQARNLTEERIQQSITEEVQAEAAERGFVHGSRDWEDFVERELVGRMDDLHNAGSIDEPEIQGEVRRSELRNLLVRRSPELLDF